MRSEMSERIRQKLKKLWWYLLLRGILMLVLGLFLVLMPAETLAALSLALGAYWFVQGICSIAGIFVKASDTLWAWLLLDGVIGVLAGIFVMNHRMFVPTTLAAILAILAFLMGAVNLVQGFRGDGARAVIMGGLNILFGILLVGHTLSTMYFLSVIFGVLAIISGIVLIALTLLVPNARPRSTGGARMQPTTEDDSAPSGKGTNP